MFGTEYGDNFSTPRIAYRHIGPILNKLRPGVIYDPYYCVDTVREGLGSVVGADTSVINACRDFYKDLSDGTVPSHDVLVTNPPYSSDHKERIIDFCANGNSGRPYFALMPSYVANRKYYRDLVEGGGDYFFVVPRMRYEYKHPEATGHDTSPFFSVWFCGNVGEDVLGGLEASTEFSVVRSIGELEEGNVEGVRGKGEKRPSSKRRKKIRMKKINSSSGGGFDGDGDGDGDGGFDGDGDGDGGNDAGNGKGNGGGSNRKKRRKESKHRDDNGKRTKKRF